MAMVEVFIIRKICQTELKFKIHALIYISKAVQCAFVHKRSLNWVGSYVCFNKMPQFFK